MFLSAGYAFAMHLSMVAEYLALSLAISNNDSLVFLNPLAANYSTRNEETISAYLGQKAAGRFSYRFEAYWHPVGAFPVQSELIIGEEPPANAIRQSTKLSMLNNKEQILLLAAAYSIIIRTKEI